MTEQDKPSWKIRRRIIVSTLLFCGITVGYLTLHGTDTALNQSIANGLILLAGAVINGYVFGVVLDDKKRIDDDAR